MGLSAVILTYNEIDHVVPCIESLRWCDRIVVFDSDVSNEVVKRARDAGATVIRNKFVNYSEQREAALKAVEDDWIYFVDVDERSSPEQAAEIRDLIRNPEIAGYWVPRHNYLFGKLTLHAGWYPDYQLRLLQRAKAHYDMTREVHELVKLDGPEGRLKTPLIHYNYATVGQFFQKQQRYTAYAAQEMFKQGIRVKPQNYILQPIRQFIWRFVTLKGYKDGFHGLRLSLFMAWYEFQKYRILTGLIRRAAHSG